jgi:2-dehydropantoate 2-reductase
VRVYVVGRGAVGGYLGETLASVGVEVAYAPRERAQVQPFDADVVIVATKAFDTPGAVETARRAVAYPEKCVFVTPQNGVGNEELLAQAFGAQNVVAAALTTPVDRSDGRSRAANAGGLALAPMGDRAFNWLVATFASAGLRTMVVDDWRALKWSKLALNVVANASCAILGVLPNRVVAYREIFALEIEMIREVRAVMRALGLQPIDLPRYPVRALFAAVALPNPVARAILASRVAGARGTKPPSLLLDLRAGRTKTEVGVLNGAVAAAGREAAVATPVNACYARVLEEIARSPERWARFRERPDALVAEVEKEADARPQRS